MEYRLVAWQRRVRWCLPARRCGASARALFYKSAPRAMLAPRHGRWEEKVAATRSRVLVRARRDFSAFAAARSMRCRRRECRPLTCARHAIACDWQAQA